VGTGLGGGGSFYGVKAAEALTYHSRPSSAEVNNELSYEPIHSAVVGQLYSLLQKMSSVSHIHWFGVL
jgi:hypothetical protein